MSLLAVAQPSIEATSADCDSTRPWIKALTRSRRRCATGLTPFLPAWGVAMDAKMKTPQLSGEGAETSSFYQTCLINVKTGKPTERCRCSGETNGRSQRLPCLLLLTGQEGLLDLLIINGL